MSDQNTVENTVVEANGAEEKSAHRDLYETLADCQLIEPASDKQRIFQVFHGTDSVGFTWANGVNDAIVNGAKAAGFSARVGEPKAKVTKEAVAAKLAELTDEELAALGLKRQKKSTK